MKKIILMLSILLLLSQTLFASSKIDRYALVNRHNVILTDFNSLSPLSVGSGNFTFTADLTGLQTFPEIYEQGIPLSTMADWGWHSFPNDRHYALRDTFVDVDTYGRKVPYNIIQRSPSAQYLRANPHQTNLAQLGFIFVNPDGSRASSAENLKNPEQVLNLWEGILYSRFEFDGKEVKVQTLTDNELKIIAVSVKSELLKTKRLLVSLKFPYALGQWGPNLSSWKHPEKHITQLARKSKNSAYFLRVMDNLKYRCVLKYPKNTQIQEIARHSFEIIPSGDSDSFEFCLLITRRNIKLGGYDFPIVRRHCKDYWKKFWTSGGTIDFSKSKDPRAKELERRIVLSQYLTAIQCVQEYPPAETGLTCNSWFGKFHLEMDWWHKVHFALWNRLEMFEKSLSWYKQILPAAKGIAQRQGYDGVRWPKMVGPDGQDSPSTIGPLLIWQQPHPIYYAELVYRQKPTNKVLEQYIEIVEQTAEFMASYAYWNKQNNCYDLGPPLLSAREFDVNSFAVTKNPAFELAYWAYGLETANQWRKRLGLEPEAKWAEIIKHLASLPTKDGIYIEQEFPLVSDGGHPAMLAAYGVLPKTHLVDKETMRKTLKHVMKNWNHNETWGWDYPLIAMTAARLGEPNLAVDALLFDAQKNTYLPNGHNFQELRLPVYLPGNGGLLTAVAMMAAGWDDCPDKPAPGFPDNGQWTVQYEDLIKMP